jgi:hypothetical protein
MVVDKKRRKRLEQEVFVGGSDACLTGTAFFLGLSGTCFVYLLAGDPSDSGLISHDTSTRMEESNPCEMGLDEMRQLLPIKQERFHSVKQRCNMLRSR